MDHESVTEFCKQSDASYIVHKYKISTYKTSAYRPKSNGSIERSHHVINRIQWSQKHDWDKYMRQRRTTLVFTKGRNIRRMN